MKTRLHLALLLLLAALNFTPSSWAHGTAFTYQGRLNDGGNPANGTYDFRFRLAADSLGNTFVDSAFLTNEVAVASGLFAVTLDFGSGIFTGSNLWLQVDVRTNGGGSYTTLTPSQALTAAPYAIMAGSASNLLGLLPAAQLSGSLSSAQLSGTYSGAVTLENPTNDLSGNGAGLSNVNAATLGGLSSSNFWQLGGNAGTAAGAHFLGTTDNQTLELRVDGRIAFRLVPHIDGANIIGGSSANIVSNGVGEAVIAGGSFNRVGANFAVIGGGHDNGAFGAGATVAGGQLNTAGNIFDTVGGGHDNTADGIVSTVAGGAMNSANGNASVIGGGANNRTLTGGSTISGGVDNIAAGFVSAIPGGRSNETYGAYSLVGGYRAKTIHDGTFVWADSTEADFRSTGGNQFLIRASGGVGINTPSPAADLQVNGSVLLHYPNFAPGPVSSSNLLNLIVGGGSNPVATNGNLNGISFYETTTVKAMSLGYDGSGSASENALRIYDVNDIARFTFEASGKLGIATTTPVTALHVTDALDAQISVESSDAGGHRWSLQSSRVAGSTTNDASFQIFDRTLNASRLFIGTNGNVGIGTTTPTNKLHVAGGVSATAFISTSDRNAKENFAPVSPREVLDKVTALPITTWTFKELPGPRHIGPMAQDFYAAFGLGGSDTTITTIDTDGVALAAIQGLNQKVDDQLKAKDARIASLEQELSALKELVMRINTSLQRGGADAPDIQNRSNGLSSREDASPNSKNF